jgi:arylsulfatase A-like enzyme
VTHSTCCPSRSSILRGQYSHNHQVQQNGGPYGGAKAFRDNGHERSNVATWLKAGGYRTVLIGKYLNGYGEEDPTTYVPPGWDEWYALLGRAPYYNYVLNANGELVLRGNRPEDYQTDLLARLANDYVRRAATEEDPFFMYLAPKPPKGPFTPAPRHEGTFADEEAPRPPSFNEEDTSDKRSWANDIPQFSPKEVAEIDDEHRKRLRMLLAVDDMVAGLVETLRESGELENTYIFFTSDNGYQLGEHRLFQDKQTPYEESIRLPLLVRGPGIPAGRTVSEFALNNDFAPTFAELAGTTAPDTVDGRSLTPLLAGGPPEPWRSAFLVEHWPDNGVNAIPEYKALRTADYKYVSYAAGQRELYDLTTDPYEIENFHDSADSVLRQRLEARLADLKGCAGEECRAAEDAP